MYVVNHAVKTLSNAGLIGHHSCFGLVIQGL